jgi:hypothetical protein
MLKSKAAADKSGSAELEATSLAEDERRGALLREEGERDGGATAAAIVRERGRKRTIERQRGRGSDRRRVRPGGQPCLRERMRPGERASTSFGGQRKDAVRARTQFLRRESSLFDRNRFGCRVPTRHTAAGLGRKGTGGGGHTRWC